MKNELGNQIAASLKERGLRLVDFAKASGLCPSTVSGILRGWLPIGPTTLSKVRVGLLALKISKKEGHSDGK